uniref:Uncharacterized protein n=1 Tax=Rhizophora mucronata TaxID=61149 RepID=A0A2P2QUT2_RHIMU
MTLFRLSRISFLFSIEMTPEINQSHSHSRRRTRTHTQVVHFTAQKLFISPIFH